MAFNDHKKLTVLGHVWDLAKAAKLEEHPMIQQAVLADAITDGQELVDGLAEWLKIQAAIEQMRDVPFKNTRPERLAALASEGQGILIGRTHHKQLPVVLPVNHLGQHAVILGATGVGKSTDLVAIGVQAVALGVRIMFVDRYKQEFRQLTRHLPNLLVFDHKSLAWNPLQVHAPLTPFDTIDKFVGTFVKSNSLLDGGENMLRKAVHELYRILGIFDGSQNYPTLYDVLEYIQALRFRPGARRLGFQESLINRLEAYLAECPELYSYRQGLPIEQIGALSFVLETGAMAERHARFLTSDILFTLHRHRMAKGEHANTLRNLVIIDEAKAFAPRLNKDLIGYYPIAQLLAEARASGIGFVLADQTSELDSAVFANTATKIAFRLGDGNCQKNMATAMALTPEQQAYFPRLKVGEAILTNSAIPHPVLIETPKMNEGKTL